MNAPALLLKWISSFPRVRTVKVRILGHTSREIAINYGVPQGSPISPLLLLLYMSKLPKLLPNTRRSLFADDFMIYSESSMDDLTLFNSDHRIILSCTKSVWVHFERKKRNRLQPQDVTRQVISSSSSVKFLGITFGSALTSVLSPLLPVIASINWTLSSLQPMAPLPLPSSASTNPISVHCLITVRQLHATYNLGRWYKLISFREHFPFHLSSTTTENGSTRNLPSIHDRNLYLAKRWYRRAMQHNRGYRSILTNTLTTDIRSSRTTPFELIRN